jgi:hypothetical protein
MKALFGELNELLGRTESPSGRTTGGTLVDVVAEGDPANIGTWIRDTATNWDQIRPYTKVAFEAAAVDHVARNWTPGRWGADEERMLDVLTAAWAGLLC